MRQKAQLTIGDLTMAEYEKARAAAETWQRPADDVAPEPDILVEDEDDEDSLTVPMCGTSTCPWWRSPSSKMGEDILRGVMPPRAVEWRSQGFCEHPLSRTCDSDHGTPCWPVLRQQIGGAVATDGHEFVGFGADCGEGRLHYLHGEGAVE